MNRRTQAAILLLFGGALLHSALTGQYLSYVKETLHPALVATGAALVAAAVVTLWYDSRPAPGAEDGHAHHEPRIGWLLLLPVAGLLLIAPPGLGSFTAGRAGSIQLSTSGAHLPALPPDGILRLGLVDYTLRVLHDDSGSLTGRTVVLTGFVTAGQGGTPLLTRIVVNCCAADGRPVKVGLTGTPAVDAPAGTWVQVVGTASPLRATDPVSRAELASLDVVRWEPVPAPERQYE